MAHSTSRLGLEIPDGTDPVSAGPAGPFSQSLGILDAAVTVTEGTISARPAASLYGKMYYATDTNQWFLDTGSAWFTVGPDTTGVRHLLLQASGVIAAGTGAGDYFFTGAGNTLVVNGGGAATAYPLWMGDAGYNSQGQDFQVANKSPYVRLRATLAINATAPTGTVTVGLYALAALAGGAGAVNYTFTTPAVTTVAQATPAGSTVYGLTGAQFAMPVTGLGYGLGVNVSGTTAANSMIAVTAQLYGYNA